MARVAATKTIMSMIPQDLRKLFILFLFCQIIPVGFFPCNAIRCPPEVNPAIKHSSRNVSTSGVFLYFAVFVLYVSTSFFALCSEMFVIGFLFPGRKHSQQAELTYGSVLIYIKSLSIFFNEMRTIREVLFRIPFACLF